MAVFNTISSLTNTVSLSGTQDINAPYNFQDWKVRNSNIPPGDLFGQYNAYLKGWYTKRAVSNVVSIDHVVKYYKTFLKIFLPVKNITEKNPAKNPPNNTPFDFPNLSTANGKTGRSITCIKGVSFRKDNLESSKFFTNSVRIAVFA